MATALPDGSTLFSNEFVCQWTSDLIDRLIAVLSTHSSRDAGTAAPSAATDTKEVKQISLSKVLLNTSQTTLLVVLSESPEEIFYTALDKVLRNVLDGAPPQAYAADY